VAATLDRLNAEVARIGGAWPAIGAVILLGLIRLAAFHNGRLGIPGDCQSYLYKIGAW
jgi:hypothetical protein